MSNTLKYQEFSMGDIKTKKISQVPGIGPVGATKLKRCKILKADQLYQTLHNFNYNKTKFHNWICTKWRGIQMEHFNEIYGALMVHKQQFCPDTVVKSEPETPQTSETPEQPAAHDAGSNSVVESPQPNNSNQADISMEVPDHNISAYPHFNADDPMTHILGYFLAKRKSIHKKFHAELFMDIINILDEYELKTQEKSNEPVPLTSQAGNGV